MIRCPECHQTTCDTQTCPAWSTDTPEIADVKMVVTVKAYSNMLSGLKYRVRNALETHPTLSVKVETIEVS